MNEQTTRLLFALIRSAVSGEKLTDEEKTLYSEEPLPALVSVAKYNDVLHLVALGLKNNDLNHGDREIETEMFKAVYRYERINHEQKRICGVLERSGIDYIPLKGAVIRQYYPKPWMRTSCDIDILVHDEDAERAAEQLCSAFGYKYEMREYHDISLISPNGVHLELHFSICETMANIDVLLSRCWEFSSPVSEHEYRFVPEFFMYYHVAHTVYHFMHGGCGVRPMLDYWLLEKHFSFDRDAYMELLKSCGIDRFAECLEKLVRAWFGGGEHTAVTRQMENYILRGGVYGNVENMVAVQQQKRGGRVRYALSRIFLPYEKLKYSYPVLEKHRWLTPIMEVRRWCRLIFCGHVKRSIDELKLNGNISKQEAEATRMFLSEIGL